MTAQVRDHRLLRTQHNFRDQNIVALYEKILEGGIEWPSGVVIQTENQTKILDQHRAKSRRIAEQGLLKPPLHKTQQFEMSTLYKGIDEWNRIPNEIKASKTV